MNNIVDFYENLTKLCNISNTRLVYFDSSDSIPDNIDILIYHGYGKECINIPNSKYYICKYEEGQDYMEIEDAHIVSSDILNEKVINLFDNKIPDRKDPNIIINVPISSNIDEVLKYIKPYKRTTIQNGSLVSYKTYDIRHLDKVISGLKRLVSLRSLMKFTLHCRKKDTVTIVSYSNNYIVEEYSLVDIESYLSIISNEDLKFTELIDLYGVGSRRELQDLIAHKR